MAIDIMELIHYPRFKSFDEMLFIYNNSTGDIRFYRQYLKSGSIEHADDTTSLSRYSLSRNMKIYSRDPLTTICDPIAEFKYKDRNTELAHYVITNSMQKGAVSAWLPLERHTLISSGKLSGCTACSICFRDTGECLFFHVGRTLALDSNSESYMQFYRNRDLYVALLLCLKERGLIDDTFFYLNSCVIKLNDSELVYYVRDVLKYSGVRAFANIYISKHQSETSGTYIGKEALLVNDDNSDGIAVDVRYYRDAGELLITYSESYRFYSCYYLYEDVLDGFSRMIGCRKKYCMNL